MTTTWRFPSEPDSVPEARRVVRRAMLELTVTERIVHAVLLCVTEAVTNAVVHAYRDGEQGVIELEVLIAEREFRCYVRDWGCGIRPRLDSPGLGLGMPLIGQLTSQYAVTPVDGRRGTEIAMRFDFDD